MTVAALPLEKARVAALLPASGEQAELMGRLVEKAKEDVLVSLLGALGGVATAITLAVQRLQALQEEAAAHDGQAVSACAKGFPSAGSTSPAPPRQAEQFELGDDEDSTHNSASADNDGLEAEYDSPWDALVPNAAAARHGAPGMQTAEQAMELLRAVGALAAPPAEGAPPSAPATLAAATAAAGEAVAALPTVGLAAEQPELPVSRSRRDDEVVCSRCRLSPEETVGPDRTDGSVWIGSKEFHWLCFHCAAAYHKENGDLGEARMQELMARAATRRRCPSETPAAEEPTSARCGPSWLVPAAEGMLAEDTEPRRVAYSWRRSRNKVEAEVVDGAAEPECCGGTGHVAVHPAVSPSPDDTVQPEERAETWLEEQPWHREETLEQAAAYSEPPASTSQPLAAAGRPPAAPEAAGQEEEEEGEATWRGAVQAAQDVSEEGVDDGVAADARAVCFEAVADISAISKASTSADVQAEQEEAFEYFQLRDQGETSGEEALALEEAKAEPIVEAEEAAREHPSAAEERPLETPAPLDSEYFIVCYTKDWKREEPMRPVKPYAACAYADVGGTWLAHPLAFRTESRTSRFQIVCCGQTESRAIWTGAIHDATDVDSREKQASRNSWPLLELRGPALPARLRTKEQQMLKGLDWTASRPSGGSRGDSVAVLYNPVKELVMVRPAEEVEELRQEVQVQEEREPGLYVVRGSEGWNIPDGQAPMSKEVDAVSGELQLVQVLAMPAYSPQEQLRILKDGQSEQRLVPLVTESPENWTLRPNSAECPGEFLKDQRMCMPHPDWLLCADEGSTVRIVWRVQAKTLHCQLWEEKPCDDRKQVRAGRWKTLATRGAGSTDTTVAAVAAVGRPEGCEGTSSEEAKLEVRAEHEEGRQEAEVLPAPDQQAMAAVEAARQPDDVEACENSTRATEEQDAELEEPVAAQASHRRAAGAWEEMREEVPPLQDQCEPFAGEAAAEASVEELVQRMSLAQVVAQALPVTADDECRAYTAAAALARSCEASAEARARARAVGAAEVLAQLLGRSGTRRADAHDSDGRLLVSRARESASYAWEILPLRASAAGCAADTAREASCARSVDKSSYELLEQECLGVHSTSHCLQEPRRRRGTSWARTLSYSKVKLGAHHVPLRDGTSEDPFRIWVLGATNEVEVALAEEGLFQDANLADHVPTEVLLLGEQIRPVNLVPGHGDGVAVRSMTYEELRWHLCLGMLSPDLAAALMPGNEGQGLPPDYVLDAVEEVPTVVSMRFLLDENSLLALKKMAKGRLLWKPAPCPFSSCPEGSAAAFADNGWILAVQGPGLLKRAWTIGVPHITPPGEPRPKGELMPACFWGILDIKYDTARPVLERVKVLETGDGKTSKFSGDGADLRRRYQEKYTPSEDSSIAMYEVISADKLLTHNLTADNGYEHVLPRQACFERRYKPDLAEHIASQLGLTTSEDLVVLKLCNRTRSAGVVIAPRWDLDRVLRELLVPPVDLEAWFRTHGDAAFKGARLDLGIEQNHSFKEHQRHWWSNECPVFVAETCEQSLLTQRDGEHYDGTMRAGFVLRRRGAQSAAAAKEKVKKALQRQRETGQALPPEYYEEEDEQESPGTSAEDFEIDWLGCYWKLPKKPRSSSSSTSGSIDSTREGIVSAARTSGTAPVHPAHCYEVYAALGDLVPRLFCTAEFQPDELEERYSAYPGLPAYLTASLGVTVMRMKSRRERQRAEELFDKALGMLNVAEKTRGAAQASGVSLASSFVHREFCSCLARQKTSNWGKSVCSHREESLKLMPTNANALYIKGMGLWQSGSKWEAEKPLLHSLLLDPDFKLAYVQLGILYLQLELWDKAIAVCEAGLERNPSQPQFKYHIGLAVYAEALKMRDTRFAEDLRQKALENLNAARQSPEARRVAKGHAPFTPKDDLIVTCLEKGRQHTLEEVKLSPKVGWVCASNRI